MLFSPPAGLRQLVADAGGRVGSRDLFVKRVAAVGGDTVELLPSGAIKINGVPRAPPPLQCDEETPPSIFPGRAAAGPLAAGPLAPGDSEGVSRVIPEGALFVLGDCPARSTDSRAWGPLPVESVVARPVVRVWPLDRQGAIDASTDLNPFRRLSQPKALGQSGSASSN